MANMSYCRFRNTFVDLYDCVNAMDEAYTLSDMDLSQDELEAMTMMEKLCRRFLDNLEKLRNAEEFTGD